VREARVLFLLRHRECHPVLDAEEALPSPSPFLVCALGVDDASPGLHPVDRAWLDLPVGAQAVAVPDAAVEQVGDGGEIDVRMTDCERGLLTQIFRFFTQSDVEMGDNYLKRYIPIFQPLEIQMMMAAFTNMETVHIDAYALLL